MASRSRPEARSSAAPAPGAGLGAVARLAWRPHRGWRRIERAPASVAGLFAAVALPLAALPGVAGMIHDLAYGRTSMGIIQYRPTPGGAVTTAAATWLAALVLLALLALGIAAAAPRFRGKGDLIAAVKAATFGSSAFLLTSLFATVPALGVLQLLGLYSLFLLAIGAPRLMKVPQERAVAFGAVTAAAGFAAAILLLVVAGWIARESLEATVKTAAGRVVVTDDPTISGARLTAPANTKKGAVAPGSGAGPAAGAVPASSLQALLPDRIGEFARTSVESESSTLNGVASANAKGTYVAGTNSFTLSIADAGRPGALATDDSIVAGEMNRTTDTGYRRSRVVNGVRIVEKWNTADHGGAYSRTVVGRFTVEAQGTAPAIETLRGAVASVDAGRLARLGR